MAKIKDDGQRRVYVLPSDLVNRITQFQIMKGISSEVEAVRKLLDEALKLKDKEEDIIIRLKNEINSGNDIFDAARYILVGHPLINKIWFLDDLIEFEIKGSGLFRADSLGNVEKQSNASNEWHVWPVNIHETEKEKASSKSLRKLERDLLKGLDK